MVIMSQGIQTAKPDKILSDLRKSAFREIYGKSKQTDQHQINGDEINAGHHGHAQIVVAQDADQIAYIHHGCTNARKPKKPSGGRFLKKRFHRKNSVGQSNQDGNNDIAVKKHGTQIGHPLLNGSFPANVILSSSLPFQKMG